MKKIKKCQSGQAIFEFIMFFPFMIILYSITISMVNALNGSINQNKIVRGHFYNFILNDSKAPISEVLNIVAGSGVQSSGLFAFGWRDRLIDKKPVAPCYKILSLTHDPIEETCSPGQREKTTTQFIRVKTVYGVCTTSYSVQNGEYLHALDIGGNVGSYGSCLNQ